MDQPIKAIIFDLDDTLFDHHHSLRSGLSALQAAYPFLQDQPLDDLTHTYVALIDSLHLQVLQGILTQDQARIQRIQSFFDTYGHPLMPDETRAAANLYRQTYQDARQPVPGAMALLAALRPTVQIGVITNNTAQEQREKLDICGFTPWIDVLVISEEVGVIKPNPAIFAIALQRLACLPNQAIMVGDSWNVDVLGARAAGIPAVWFNRFGAPIPDPTLATMLTALEPISETLRLLENASSTVR